MDETNPDILEARAKLKAKFESRIGGKGTQRRKVKAKTASVVVADDKKLQGQFKKIGLNPIPGVEEVNMFTDKNEVIHFKEPKVLASLQANTYAVCGPMEVRELTDMLPKVISQVGSENLNNLRKDMQGGDKKADDEIPDLEDTNFEEVSKE